MAHPRCRAHHTPGPSAGRGRYGGGRGPAAYRAGVQLGMEEVAEEIRAARAYAEEAYNLGNQVEGLHTSEYLQEGAGRNGNYAFRGHRWPSGFGDQNPPYSGKPDKSAPDHLRDFERRLRAEGSLRPFPLANGFRSIPTISNGIRR